MRVTLKLATSLDGCIATATGESQWITGAESRKLVHDMRRQHDAVVVGIGTALADNPLLNVRLENNAIERQPDRIILDSRLRFSSSAKMLSLKEGRTILVTSEAADKTAEAILSDAGAIIIRTAVGNDGRPDLKQTLVELDKLGIRSIFVEGGGMVAASFLKAGLVDRLEWFRAPLIIGGDGRKALGPLGVEALVEAFRFRRVDVRAVGNDVLESFERE